MFGSLTASAALIYLDDGNRTLAASQPLVALFLATGFTNPAINSNVKQRDDGPLLRGFAGFVLAAVLLATIPWLSHKVSSANAARETPSGSGDVFVFGGQKLFGFLVVADSDPLRTDVPTIHLSDFGKIVAEGGIEQYQELLHPVTPPLPFGFVFAPRLEHGLVNHLIYIVPPKVLERQDILAWRFKTAPWRDKPDANSQVNYYWIYVTDATPWPMVGQ
jgi:hypothetical protein